MSSQESDVEERLVDLDINEDKHGLDTFNLLLLGETGVGKSTFINSVANYLTYKYFDVAEKNDLHVLIPCVFGMKDKYQKDHRIEIGCSSDVNEYIEIGASATQDIRTYLFPIWRGKVKVRIIDTPGLGDTRGIEQDEKNCRKVLKYVSKLDYLHGICFLFKPTVARKTMFFEYCFSQLLCHLDKSACNKLFFIFTKTRGANYGATDTISVLETIISEIKKYSPDVDIPLLDSNTFCFDNEGFRYIAAHQQKIEFTDEEKSNYKKSWKASVKNWWNLMKSVRSCNQILYTPTNIAALTDGRHTIRCFSVALSEISDSIRDNDTLLQKLLLNYNADTSELEEMKTKQTFKAAVVYKEQKSTPSMICTESNCIETYKVGNDTQRHYKTICHTECEEAINAKKNIVGHPELVNCYVINNTNRQCSHCKCDFSAHMLVDYHTVVKEDNVLDEDKSKQIKKKESLIRSSLDVVHELQRKSSELMQEYDIIKEVCRKLASVICQTAIVPYNYCYGEYVEQCIMTEQSTLGSNKTLLENYKKLLKENEELNKIFDDALTTNQAISLLDSDISLEEIESRYDQLFSLKFSGRRIRELLSKDQVLIENDNEFPEYVHDSKFDYKKDRRTKDRQKTNKEDKKSSKKKGYSNKHTDKNGKESENDDSDASSVKSKETYRKNITKSQEKVNESSDGYASCKSSKSNSQKWHGEKRGNSKNNSNKTWDYKSDNTQRSRTPPPPYSQIWTPSREKQLSFNNNSSHPYSFVPNRSVYENREPLTNNGNQSNGTGYEITLSFKERHKNPTSGFHSQEPPNYLQGFPPRPNLPPNVLSHPCNPRHAPPNPRFSAHPLQGPPMYHQPAPRFSVPNHQYVRHDPRYPSFPGSNTGFPMSENGFTPPNTGFPVGVSRFPPPLLPYSVRPPRSDRSTTRQNDGTSQQSKKGHENKNKNGKSKNDNSGDENREKKPPKSGHKDGTSQQSKSGHDNKNKNGKSRNDNSGDKNREKKTPKSGHKDGKDNSKKN